MIRVFSDLRFSGIVRRFGGIFGHVEPFWGHFGACGAILGAFWGMWSHFGGILGHVEPFWGHFGACGAILGILQFIILEYLSTLQ
jgi:hypothetical protein